MAPVTSKTVSYVTGTSNRQESWDELRKHQHCFLVSHCSSTFILWKMFFSSHCLKIWSSPKISWPLIGKKASSKVPFICKPSPNSVKLVQSQRVPSLIESEISLCSLLLFPSLLPGDVDPFVIRAWEERKGKRSRRVLIGWPCFRAAL